MTEIRTLAGKKRLCIHLTDILPLPTENGNISDFVKDANVDAFLKRDVISLVEKEEYGTIG